MRHMQGNNNRNGNGKETGMKNQRGKDTGMQDTPTIPTLSDQKKPFFPTERKAHPQTTPSLLPKAVHHFPYCQKKSLPYRRKNNVSLPTAENKITPR